MDHCCDFDRVVDAGDGVCLYHGWIHSHLADIGSCSCGDTVNEWASSRLRHSLMAALSVQAVG